MDSIPYTMYYPSFDFQGDTIVIENAHNLYVDEKGILCMTGGNALGGSPILLDVEANPTEPPVVGYVPGDYSHDVYMENDILYSSEIFAGQLSIYDVTDKRVPVRLGNVETSFAFTHNAWASDDGNYVFTTDERRNAFVDAYDISDPTDIKRVSQIRPRRMGEDVIPHNTHYHNGYLITSWYGEGVVVIDANKPDNIIISGQYDTNVSTGGSMGCWGAYPYLPSGLVLATDRQNGLFVFEPNYTRASYLEGCVTDALTGEPLSGVSISIFDTQNGTESDLDGTFRTGHGVAGQVDVFVDLPGYEREIVSLELVSGEVTELKVALRSREEVMMNFTVVDGWTGEVVPEAQIFLTGPTGNLIFAEADSTGVITTSSFLGQHEVITGAWGYFHKVESIDINSLEILIEVEQGYQDDFFFDLGWKVDNDEWSRVSAQDDVPTDIGERHYQATVPFSQDAITSPVMDLRRYNEPIMSFSSRVEGQTSELRPFLVMNQTDVIELPPIPVGGPGWIRHNYSLSQFIGDFSTAEEVVLTFETATADDGIGIDAFLITELTPSSTEDAEEVLLGLYPNPVSDLLSMEWSGRAEGLSIVDSEGQVLHTEALEGSSSHEMDMSGWASGVYLVQIRLEQGPTLAQKVVKI